MRPSMTKYSNCFALSISTSVPAVGARLGPFGEHRHPARRVLAEHAIGCEVVVLLERHHRLSRGEAVLAVGVLHPEPELEQPPLGLRRVGRRSACPRRTIGSAAGGMMLGSSVVVVVVSATVVVVSATVVVVSATVVVVSTTVVVVATSVLVGASVGATVAMVGDRRQRHRRGACAASASSSAVGVTDVVAHAARVRSVAPIKGGIRHADSHGLSA